MKDDATIFNIIWKERHQFMYLKGPLRPQCRESRSLNNKSVFDTLVPVFYTLHSVIRSISLHQILLDDTRLKREMGKIAFRCTLLHATAVLYTK